MRLSIEDQGQVELHPGLDRVRYEAALVGPLVEPGEGALIQLVVASQNDPGTQRHRLPYPRRGPDAGAQGVPYR